MVGRETVAPMRRIHSEKSGPDFADHSDMVIGSEPIR